MVDDDPTAIQMIVESLSSLRATQGIFGIYGNHDVRRSQSKLVIATAMEGIGIRMLENETAFPFGQGFALVGLGHDRNRIISTSDFQPAKGGGVTGNLWRSPANSGHSAFAGLNPQIPRLVLSHDPETAEDLKGYRVDLQLSGHTHGGQIRLPLFGPLLPHLYRYR